MKRLCFALLMVFISSQALAFKDCDTCPELVDVPAGSFQMGANSGHMKPKHRVDIGYGFAVGKYEVTQAQWRAVMDTDPSKFTGENHPVDQVSWNEVQVFLQKLSTKTGQTYRLLSEAEWEYAARAGTTTKWSCGNKKACVKDIGWHKGISDKQSHPVGLKTPNAFGLYDMAGNVREWTADCYQTDHQGAPNDGSAVQIQAECHKRTVKGGSWYYLPRDHRLANRHKVFVTFKLNDVGFRVAR